MKKYFKGFILELKKAKEYFLCFISSLFYTPISILIYYFLFKFIINGSTGFSMTLNEILIYYAVVLFIKSTITHSMAEVYYVFSDINNGDLDLWLTKPVYYPLVRYFRSLGSVAITIPSGILFLLIILIGKYSIINIILFLISVFLGFTLLFFVMFILGSLTFWLKNVLSLRDIFWCVLAFFSGEIIPLNLISNEASFLLMNPLAGVYFLPTEVLKSPNPIYILAIQSIYVIFFMVIAFVVFKLGIVKYESQGG